MSREDVAAVAEDRDWVAELALLFAKNRTGGDVYMSGEHNPRPSEVQKARQFLADYDAAGDRDRREAALTEALRKASRDIHNIAYGLHDSTDFENCRNPRCVAARALLADPVPV